jgi:hypothetical protein
VEQLVIVLIIAAVSVIKWLMEKSAEARAARRTAERIGDPMPDVPKPAPPRPAHPMASPRPVAHPVSDLEDAARRLREALGLPEENELPPPVQRKPELPPIPSAPRPEPVILFERPLPDFRKAPPVERPRELPRIPASSPILRPPVEEASTARSDLDELLRSRDGLRRAILLKEILGTPKGLAF